MEQDFVCERLDCRGIPKMGSFEAQRSTMQYDLVRRQRVQEAFDDAAEAARIKTFSANTTSRSNGRAPYRLQADGPKADSSPTLGRLPGLDHHPMYSSTQNPQIAPISLFNPHPEAKNMACNHESCCPEKKNLPFRKSVQRPSTQKQNKAFIPVVQRASILDESKANLDIEGQGRNNQVQVEVPSVPVHPVEENAGPSEASEKNSGTYFVEQKEEPIPDLKESAASKCSTKSRTNVKTEPNPKQNDIEFLNISELRSSYANRIRSIEKRMDDVVNQLLRISALMTSRDQVEDHWFAHADERLGQLEKNMLEIESITDACPNHSLDQAEAAQSEDVHPFPLREED